MLSLVVCTGVWGDWEVKAKDLAFAAAVEDMAKGAPLPSEYASLVEQLDSDVYKKRASAGKRLLELCRHDKQGERWLMRARLTERRAEVRYWLNRLLRTLHVCETCGGWGYCRAFEPSEGDAGRCRKCGQPSSRHGAQQQWVDGDYRRTERPCDNCRGEGSAWPHVSVD